MALPDPRPILLPPDLDLMPHQAQVVVARLGDVLRQAPAVLQRLSSEDRALLETALLYVIYHRHVPQIDAPAVVITP